MRLIVKYKWIIAAWVLALTVILNLFSPNLTELANQKGQVQLPADSVSEKAKEILKGAGENNNTISVVFSLDHAFKKDEKESMRDAADQIKKIGGVKGVTSPFSGDKEIQDQLISKDKKTVLIPVTVTGSDKQVEKIADRIYQIVPDDLTAYITGASLINQDFAHSSEEGLKKTEVITVFLIIGLLLVVFRSVVTPFVPIIAVGFSYLISQSLLAILVHQVDFPISSFTQTFLVAILFGIGTDYCILLLTRFREELANGHDKIESTLIAYRTGGKTLFISGFAVLIGFSSLGFAKFAIFQSAVGVAVGVGVLMIILYTLLPLFMVTLGEKLFWPSKKVLSHSDNKLWAFLGRHSVARPFLFIIITAIITVPFMLTYDDQISFDSTSEISSSYKSVKGLEAIKEGLGEGKAFPVNVVIKGENKLTTAETIPYLGNVSKAIEKVDHVDSVMTITQPTGKEIEDLSIDHQLGAVSDGLDKATKGLGDVQKGLTDVEAGLRQIAGQAAGSAGSGQSGGSLGDAADGLGKINSQLQLISKQMAQTGSTAQSVPQLTAISGQLGQIQSGLEQADQQLAGQKQQAGTLKASLGKLADGVKSANAGLSKVTGGITASADMLKDMSKSSAVKDTGIFIPDQVMKNKEFKKSIDNYSFSDGKGVQLSVVLDINPYSEQAITTVNQIKKAVADEVSGTPLKDATIAYGGVSSQNADLKELSTTDLSRTMAIMVIGLFAVLTILFRSMIMPIYMIASLFITYYTSISITELIFVRGMGDDGVSWAVPFFSFVILIALGVDYSIFLLDRFKEEVHLGISQGIVKSMSKMGSVIMTAAVILAGTFAAMMPSGVNTLMQVATVVIVGLLLYGLVILPLLIPAITVTFGEGNWWPFGRKKSEE
ncbi:MULTISPECIES: MMPL family transporter [Bacillus]|uniref:MMPL family transporter n=1 Tax=Bacillus glycinifermentans TaxID=1664069 RepID=A0AAJ3YVF9_9BACI|nr:MULTISPECIES: MMPL family transporter [Bacillus]KKB75524.1 membrane protein YdgH [Bacillus sp. TH008]MDU0071219.1 MMPL family transporter [Bacillus sp. IG6]MED8019087.1 MMPL family transporter [Bacillus glycinifermentans]QAT63726.1 MMPL family transporter [Bacillus glycinifermentans]WKB77598.1 MMPL family transporter [Bacillus glycinifermentans]